MQVRRVTKGWKLGLPIIFLFAAGVFLAACSAGAVTPCPEADCPEPPQIECPQEECPECPQPEQAECPQVECEACPQPEQAAAEYSYYEALWGVSAHNDSQSEAFRHWDEDDPPEIPANCAACHSTAGHLDLLGVDGTPAGSVENTAPVGDTLTCIVCHNETSAIMSSVTFPSGLEVSGLGTEARCMGCHQGLASTASVNEAIAGAGLADDDTVSEELGFINIHYAPAAAVQMGTWAMAGYQYDGKAYDARFAHVEDFDSCTDCHDQHTLELKMDGCIQCHDGVDTPDDLERLRGEISLPDYDGDGKAQEGLQREIEGFQEILYGAMQTYASQNGTPIGYDAHTYPYFFIDGDGNGELDEGEAVSDNHYNAWTGHLLKAAYNYQVSIKDPGAIVHGGKYIIQLLYDSIEDLDPERVGKLVRDDVSHFDGSSEAWRHWDEAGEVDRECARCHSASGLPTFLATGTNYQAEPVANGLLCTTCHPDQRKSLRYVAGPVVFPSDVTLSLDSDSNLCINCHQGRQSSTMVEEMVVELDADSVSGELQFPSIHYAAAGATLFGSDAGGAYQYQSKRYAGKNAHVEEFDDCVDCHGGHRSDVDLEQCATCHGPRASDERTKPQHHPSPMSCSGCHGWVEAENIRGHKDYILPTDWDGDGDLREGHSQEVATMQSALYAAIQAYASDVVGTPIVYDGSAYPHWFTDTNADGAPDPDETSYDNRYAAWTPRLIQAAYNYLFSDKDPGAYVHNGQYIIQVLYDSLADIGGDTSGMVRP